MELIRESLNEASSMAPSSTVARVRPRSVERVSLAMPVEVRGSSEIVVATLSWLWSKGCSVRIRRARWWWCSSSCRCRSSHGCGCTDCAPLRPRLLLQRSWCTSSLPARTAVPHLFLFALLLLLLPRPPPRVAICRGSLLDWETRAPNLRALVTMWVCFRGFFWLHFCAWFFLVGFRCNWPFFGVFVQIGFESDWCYRGSRGHSVITSDNWGHSLQREFVLLEIIFSLQFCEWFPPPPVKITV